MPTSIGYQDLASLIAREHGAPPSWHLIASPLGTVQAATFSYTRPIGTAIPEPLAFEDVNYDPRTLDAYAWKIDEPLNAATHARQIEYPTVNRAGKADRLPAKNAAPAQNAPGALPQLQPIAAPASAAPAIVPASPTPSVTPPLNDDQHAQATDAAPLVVQSDTHRDMSVAMAPPTASMIAPPVDDSDDDLIVRDRPPDDAAGFAAVDDASSSAEMALLGDNAGDHSAAIYFGTGMLGSREGLQSWAPGAAPILALPSEDSGIKLSALEGADYSADLSGKDSGGQSVAGKDDFDRMESPAQRLGLQGDARAHAEKCLSEAIYFEARGEPYNGQEAVAQVVMNRVFSGYYPHDVCGVVFQAKYRHPICQFTFACEGKDLNHIEEPDMWEQAKQIAKDELDGKIWLADIGHATHYHAYWVHPSWVHEMVRLYRVGVHTFYRPRAWGDDEPTWSPAAVKSETDKPQASVSPATPVVTTPPVVAAKGPQAALSPAPSDAKPTRTAKL